MGGGASRRVDDCESECDDSESDPDEELPEELELEEDEEPDEREEPEEEDRERELLELSDALSIMLVVRKPDAKGCCCR